MAVPSGTVYDIDVDPTNKYMITSGQVLETNANRAHQFGADSLKVA